MADEQQLLDLIAGSRQGILAAVKSDGFPHLSNVLYLWDAESRTARISTTADRVKGRVLRRDPHAALHVAGSHFWAYAVAEGEAEASATAATPGDEASRELLEVHSALGFTGDDEDEFFQQMIDAKRLVVRLKATRIYGLVVDDPS